MTSAAVMLRGSGMILGRGRSTTPGRCVSEALARAMRDAERRLDVPRDARFDERMRALGSGISLSLELGHELTPFRPTTLADATLEVSPGLEGIAARLGDRLDVVFPSSMLLSGVSPGRGYRSLIAGLGNDPGLALASVDKLADSGFVFYRFDVTHLAQREPELEPTFLTRGGRVIATSEITTKALRDMGNGIAGYIAGLRTREVVGLGLRGTYLPTTDRFDPEQASAAQRALMCYALARFANCKGGGPARAARAREHADGMMLHLADEHRVTPLARDASIAALVVLGDALDVGDRTDARVAALLADSRATLDIALERPDLVPPAVRGLLAHALVVRAMRDGESLDAAAEFVRFVFRETPLERLVAQMPWLGWAELALAQNGERVPSAVALRRLREIVWDHQLQFRDTGREARDLVGGIVFTRAKNPLPTWQSLRPIVFIATMLGEGRLTEPAEVAQEITWLVRSLRFTRQLCVDQDSGMLMPNPDRAQWGVRSALWDHRVNPDACAMALLAVCESLESLDEIAKR